MRKLFILFAALFAFVACTQNDVEEFSANRADVPETLTVGFEGGDTRIELNEALKTVWTEGDEVSVFYRSDINQRWQYQGETGERIGDLRRVDAGSGTPTKTTKVVIAYPYDEAYYLNSESCNLQAMLPAVQSYKNGSYGEGGNILVSQSEYNQFSLKSVCGWLRVELTGEGQMVESITLRGNAGEQVAGLCYINAADASIALAESDVDESLVATDVRVDCGSGVTLDAEATEFYIALLPQTFEKGLTVEVDYANAEPQTLVYENAITICRNHISPIGIEANVEVEIPTNQLWYTATALVESNSSAFNVAIVSNEWDETTSEGVITFDGELTTIGTNAFYWCGSLTSVTIGNSVTTIGESAFDSCYSLTSVTIGNSVTTIGSYAFWNCSSLTSVTIPDSVTTIGEGAFERCTSLTSVTIGDSVTTIGNMAFAICSSLAEFKGKFAADGGRCLIKDNTLIAYAEASGTTYTILDSVTTIGEAAFSWCSSLTSVTIPDSVTTIGEGAFYNCSNLTSATIGDSVTTIGDSAFERCTSLTSVTIPNSVTAIGDYAFDRCSSLTSITIPDSVTTIGDYAFSGCDSLTSVTIPDSVTTIGEGAFRSCYSLTSVTIGNSVTTIGAAAFGGCSNLAEFKGKFAADGGRCLIKDNAIIAYAEASGTTYTIPDSVTTIGTEAFSNCNSLTSVTIPDSVTTIGINAFGGCSSLTSVTILDSVTTIGDYAFSVCDSLTSVTIPDSVTTIGNFAFCDCESLSSVYCEATTPPTLGGSYVFDYNASGRKIYVPAASVEAYKSAENWSEYAADILGYNFATGEVAE